MGPSSLFPAACPKQQPPCWPKFAGGRALGLPNSLYFALAALLVVSFVLKKSVAGRRFEAIGANPLATRAVGLRVQLHQLLAYVYAQLLYCMAGLLLAGITREPTAFQGDSLLLPSSLSSFSVERRCLVVVVFRFRPSSPRSS
jgi:Ribose/xylose/arabinose/galactoside ABC-type transport systems, permease components